MPVCPVLSQSQSVPVIPLKGTTPEATQVWETVLCRLPPPPASLPAQSATSVHTGDRALYKSGRSPQPENTVTQLTILKLFLGSLRASQSDFSTGKALVGCRSPCEERSGSGALMLPEVHRSYCSSWEEMILIPNTFQLQYEASSFKTVLFQRKLHSYENKVIYVWRYSSLCELS